MSWPALLLDFGNSLLVVYFLLLRPDCPTAPTLAEIVLLINAMDSSFVGPSFSILVKSSSSVSVLPLMLCSVPSECNKKFKKTTFYVSMYVLQASMDISLQTPSNSMVSTTNVNSAV